MLIISKAYSKLSFKSFKRIATLILTLLLMCLFVSCSPSQSVSGNNIDEESASHESEKNKSEEDNNESVDTSEIDSNENGVNIDGSIISWANMEVDNPDLNLTDNQLQVLKYFDVDYLYLSDYDALQRYPMIYRNAQVSFEGTVIKILETNDETYTGLVWMNGTSYFDGSTMRPFEPTNDEFIVITGKHPDNARVIEGDWFQFYGRYKDVESYAIDGKDSYYPTVSVNYTVQMGIEGAEPRFGLDDIRQVAKTILGNDIKISEPVYGEDFELDELHSPQYFFYMVTPDNQTNANFSKFEFSRMNGFIRSADSTLDSERNFLVSADFEHYIVTVFDRSLHLMYLEYYDRDYKKLWSREFDNVDNAVLDYTAETIYLVSDNDLYAINTENGEDRISPVMVGEKIKISVLRDGIILIGTGNKDNVMKTDLEGNIIWKTSVDLEVTACYQIQIVDGNVITNLVHTETETSDEMFGGGEKVINYISEIVAVDTDGNVISEYIDSQYSL